MTTAVRPFVTLYDTSGDYDLFLYGLIGGGKLNPKGDNIYLVLHEDEDKALFIPRDTVKNAAPSRRVFINRWDMETLHKMGDQIDAYKSAEMFLDCEGRNEKHAHFILWEDEKTMVVIPIPELLRNTIKQSNKEKQRRIKQLLRQSKGGF